MVKEIAATRQLSKAAKENLVAHLGTDRVHTHIDVLGLSDGLAEAFRGNLLQEWIRLIGQNNKCTLWCGSEWNRTAIEGFMSSGSTSHIDFAIRLGVDTLGNQDILAPASREDQSRLQGEGLRRALLTLLHITPGANGIKAMLTNTLLKTVIAQDKEVSIDRLRANRDSFGRIIKISRMVNGTVRGQGALQGEGPGTGPADFLTNITCEMDDWFGKSQAEYISDFVRMGIEITERISEDDMNKEVALLLELDEWIDPAVNKGTEELICGILLARIILQDRIDPYRYKWILIGNDRFLRDHARTAESARTSLLRDLSEGEVGRSDLCIYDFEAGGGTVR